MPFVAKCHRCNYILWTLTRGMLKIAMEYHDIHSHKGYDKDFAFWIVTTISHYTFYMLERMSKLSAFWKAIRSNPEKVKPLFSDRLGGE